uniref:Uncharacterized protein n=1 Tax=Acrobeloides nanus TaxID=290746 RepID=A0A914DAJ7_9BILA
MLPKDLSKGMQYDTSHMANYFREKSTEAKIDPKPPGISQPRLGNRNHCISHPLWLCCARNGSNEEKILVFNHYGIPLPKAVTGSSTASPENKATDLSRQLEDLSVSGKVTELVFTTSLNSTEPKETNLDQDLHLLDSPSQNEDETQMKVELDVVSSEPTKVQTASKMVALARFVAQPNVYATLEDVSPDVGLKKPVEQFVRREMYTQRWHRSDVNANASYSCSSETAFSTEFRNKLSALYDIGELGKFFSDSCHISM